MQFWKDKQMMWKIELSILCCPKLHMAFYEELKMYKQVNDVMLYMQKIR